MQRRNLSLFFHRDKITSHNYTRSLCDWVDKVYPNPGTLDELCYSGFSWEEKLVAPLIGTPNVDEAIEDKWIGKKTTLQATRVIHACRKESLFFFANKLDKVLVRITLVV